MVIISQRQDKTTESLEFNIDEMKTCSNVFINEDDWKKFKKIVGKESNYCTLKELNGLGEFLNQCMTKSIYVIKETKSKRVFGIYSSKERAKKSLQGAIKTIGNKSYYQMLEDKD